jgi:hypothetical protein
LQQHRALPPTPPPLARYAPPPVPYYAPPPPVLYYMPPPVAVLPAPLMPGLFRCPPGAVVRYDDPAGFGLRAP